MGSASHISGKDACFQLDDVTGASFSLTGHGNEFTVRHAAIVTDATGYAEVHRVNKAVSDEYSVDFAGYWAGSGADSAASKLHALVGASQGTCFQCWPGGSPIEVDDETGASWGSSYHGICFAAGSAFFRAEGVDISSYIGHRLDLHDSSGNDAVGYILEADAAESLETEDVLNPGFEDLGAGPPDVFGDWIETTTGSSTVNDEGGDVHGGVHACRLDIDASNSITSVHESIAVTEGELRKLVLWFKSTGGATGQFYVYDETNAAMIMASLIAAAGAYTEHEYYLTVPAGCASARLVLYRGSAPSQSVYFDDVSFRKVADVGADGVHIVDELDGSTRNWESIDSGFDYNDDAYTFEVTHTQLQLSYSGSANVENLQTNVPREGMVTWSFALTPRAGGLTVE